MCSEAEMQQPPATSRPHPQHHLHQAWHHRVLTLAVPAGRDKKVITTKGLGTVKWFNIKNGYGFVNRNDIKEDVFVYQTAIKNNNPKKYLRSVGDGETVEFDVEVEKGAEAANVTGPSGVLVRGGKYSADHNYYSRSPRRRGPPHNYQQNYQNSESREKNEESLKGRPCLENTQKGGGGGRRVLQRAKPNSAGPTQVGVPTLPHADTHASTTAFNVHAPVQGEVIEGADNQGAGEQGRPVRQNMYGVIDHITRALLARQPRETAMKRTRKIKEMRPKVSSHLNVSIAATSTTDAGAQRTPNHKMAKRQKAAIHQLRTRSTS